MNYKTSKLIWNINRSKSLFFDIKNKCLSEMINKKRKRKERKTRILD